jgi:hypothetical protein
MDLDMSVFVYTKLDAITLVVSALTLGKFYPHDKVRPVKVNENILI